MDTNVVALKVEPRVYVLGGNASTLAFTSSLRPVSKQIVTWLVPLAWTPAGVVLGETWQRVGLAADNVAGWIDQTFPPDDERSFVTAGRELEILQRVGWHAETPERLSEGALLNPDDVPEDVLDAIGQPPVQIVRRADSVEAQGDQHVFAEREFQKVLIQQQAVGGELEMEVRGLLTLQLPAMRHQFADEVLVEQRLPSEEYNAA